MFLTGCNKLLAWPLAWLAVLIVLTIGPLVALVRTTAAKRG